jgi:hypothetical protein
MGESDPYGKWGRKACFESWRTALDKFRIMLWAPGDEMRELGDALQTTFAHIVQGNRGTQVDPREQTLPPR